MVANTRAGLSYLPAGLPYLADLPNLARLSNSAGLSGLLGLAARAWPRSLRFKAFWRFGLLLLLGLGLTACAGQPLPAERSILQNFANRPADFLEKPLPPSGLEQPAPAKALGRLLEASPGLGCERLGRLLPQTPAWLLPGDTLRLGEFDQASVLLPGLGLIYLGPNSQVSLLGYGLLPEEARQQVGGNVEAPILFIQLNQGIMRLALDAAPNFPLADRAWIITPFTQLRAGAGLLTLGLDEELLEVEVESAARPVLSNAGEVPPGSRAKLERKLEEQANQAN